MDQSHNSSYGGTHHEPTGRPSLHKKRSLVRVRSDSIDKRPRPITTATIRTDDPVPKDPAHACNGKVHNTGQRKGSIRNAVRKIFGRSRSSRIVTPAQQNTTPPRHAYHRSEPHGLPTAHESSNDDQEELNYAPQRALSTPLAIEIPPVRSNKVRSPYAVEFPKSAKLKPLDMSSPFDSPGAPLRRRKTLPSLLIAGDDAAAITTATKKSELPPMPARSSAEITRPTPSEIGVAIGGVKDKRRSRSASGMRTRDSGVASEPERKRSEEIRFWRESYQGSVLRASGFTVPFSVPPPEEQERDDKWQTSTDQRPERSTSAASLEQSPQGLRITPHSRQGTLGTLDGSTQLNFRSTSGLSRDLEDRVAQLEANLQLFQRSLNKLQAERNRRTVIVGDYSSVDQGKSYRSPSMLADSLHIPSDYMDDDEEEQTAPRPATAPVPRSPIAEYPPVPPLPGQRDDRAPDSPPQNGRSDPRKPSNLIINNPNVTFKSLYQMLADERSARRRLETQMRTLHTDIQDLQQQVSSHTYSHRNSYMLSHEATVASSRLRALLRETESDEGGHSPEDTPRKQQIYVSRFSGSTTAGVQEIDEIDHAVGAYYNDDDDEDEAQTPHEEYKTPREEQSPFHLGRDGEMF